MENYEGEITNYKKEIENLNKIIKTYEDHNLKIVDLEKKIRLIKVKHEKEIKEIEILYKEKINFMNKKIHLNQGKSRTPSKTRNNNTIEDKDIGKKSVRIFSLIKFYKNDFNTNKCRNIQISLSKSRSRTKSAEILKVNELITNNKETKNIKKENTNNINKFKDKDIFENKEKNNKNM